MIAPIDWKALERKYAAPNIPPHIRQDIQRVMEFVRVQVQENDKLHDALNGARDTMLALCSACGEIDLPYALLDKAKGGRLLVSDVKTPTGMIKRFSYRAMATIGS